MDRQALGTAEIIRANSRNLPLADDSVDLVVTSPPYFALRSYQDGGKHYEGQVGDEPTPAEFIDSLLEVTAECVRVLKPAGSLWVNLGDKYAARSAGLARSEGQIGSRAGARDANPRRPPAYKVARDAARPGAVRDKSLLGIPWRYALRCIDDLGLILRAEVIWDKPNGLPESVTDRVRRSHEQWFHFTLNPRYFSAVDEIREEHVRSWGHGNNGGTRPSASAVSGHQYDGLETSGPHALGKLPGSVWTIATQPLRVPESLGIDHFAAFPMEWPRRIIQGWAPTRGVCVDCGEGRRPVVQKPSATGHVKPANTPGSDKPRGLGATSTLLLSGSPRQRWKAEHPDTLTGYACACPDPTAPTHPAVILDPFGGTGTTALLAKVNGCHGISVDMSADYCRLAEWRTSDPDQIAAAMQVDKPAQQVAGQSDLFAFLDGGAA